MEKVINNANIQAKALGVPVCPPVNNPTKTVSKSKTETIKVAPTVKVAGQTRVPAAHIKKLETLVEVITGFQETAVAIEAGEVIISSDGRVTLKKRDTFKGDPYGAVTAIVIDGLTRSCFAHYPVYTVTSAELLGLMTMWTLKPEGIAPIWAAGTELRAMDVQFEGLCIKVLADNSGNLRFVTKKKAQLCKEYEDLLMSMLSDDAKTALKACALMGDVLTFRLVHPKVSFVKSPMDLNKPVALLCAFNDTHVRSDADLPISGVFTTAADLVPSMSIPDISGCAVMVEMYNAEKDITSYVKLVTPELKDSLKLLEGINGNLRQHLARTSSVEALRAALHPYHILELDSAVKALSEGPSVVARFVKANREALLDEKGSLRTALYKLDAKRAGRLVKCAELYKPLGDKKGDFFAKMDGGMMASHITLLVDTVESKLSHAKPEVADAAKLIKSLI
jgi:hypothetical protein